MLTVFLFAVSLQDALIDFDVRATTLTNALGKLSRVTGKTYKADPRMAGEIVCIKVKQVKPADLAEKIAAATDCEWREADGAQILYRSAEKEQELLDAEAASTEKYLKQLLQTKRDELRNPPTPYVQAEKFAKAIKALEERIAENPNGVSLDGPRLASPASTLVLRLVLDLGEKRLAEETRDKGVTFSNYPTSAQRPLGPNSAAYIKDYEETERNVGTLLPAERPKGAMSGILDDLYNSATANAPVGKVLLDVGRRGQSISFFATIYTKDGMTKTWGFTSSLNLGDNPFQRENQAGAGKQPRWIDLSPGSKILAEYADDRPVSASFEQVPILPWEKLPQAAQKIFQNPEEMDPLSFAATDGCFGLADEKEANLVAYLPDGQERSARLAVKDGRLNLTRYEALLSETGIQRQDANGWLVMKPALTPQVTKNRLPRAALGKMMRIAASTKKIDLQTYARFNYEGGWPVQSSSIARLYRRTFQKYGVATCPDVEQHTQTSYAALGSLAPTQWTNLLRGESFRIGQSAPGQRLAAENWMKAGGSQVASGVPDLLKNWTEYAPKGLPPAATLQMAVNSDVAMKSYTKLHMPDGTVKETIIDPGTGFTPTQIGEGYGKAGYYTSMDHALKEMKKARYQIFARTQVEVSMQVLPTHVVQERFYDISVGPTIGSYDDWPKEAKEQFQAAFQRAFQSKS